MRCHIDGAHATEAGRSPGFRQLLQGADVDRLGAWAAVREVRAGAEGPLQSSAGIIARVRQVLPREFHSDKRFAESLSGLPEATFHRVPYIADIPIIKRGLCAGTFRGFP